MTKYVCNFPMILCKMCSSKYVNEILNCDEICCAILTGFHINRFYRFFIRFHMKTTVKSFMLQYNVTQSKLFLIPRLRYNTSFKRWHKDRSV